MRPARRLAAQYRDERRTTGILLLVLSGLLLAGGWAFAFSPAGLPLLVAGAITAVTAPLPQPTLRFALACLAVLVIGSGGGLWIAGAIITAVQRR